MKTKLLAAAVALVVLSAFAKIILYTDKPNAVPVSSDFFSLQRNSDYINASVGQVKGDWFNNPVFTGNGSISGNFTAVNYFGNGSNLSGITASFGPVITNNTFINTNVAFINLETNNIFVNTNVAFINIQTNNTFVNTNVTILSGSSNYINNVFETNVTIVVPGGATNLNLTPNSLMQSDSGDAESSVGNGTGVLTNNGAGVFGWVPFSGLGGNFVLANNGNGTNTTNWGVTSYQDLQAQNAELTNLFTGLTNFLVLGTDGDGKLTLGSATNSFTAITITSTTNIFNVAKGGHLTVTNEITDLGITASSIVGTDPNSVLTNVNLGLGLLFSGNILKPNATNQVWTDTGGKIAPVTNRLNTILGDISQTPTHLLHIFHTNAANNDVVGIDSTSSDSSSMFHIKNRTAQGPFFDYEAANVRWGFGISSGNSFVLRTGPNAADPVNGSTVVTITTNGDFTVRGFTNLNTSASQFKITDSFNGEQTTLDASTLTNLSYTMGTNNGGGNAIVAGAPGTGLVCILTNITADTTLKAFTFWTAGLSVVPVYASCSGGANKQLKFPANFQGAGDLYGVDLNGTGDTITNGEAKWFEVRCIYGVKTNVFHSATK